MNQNNGNGTAMAVATPQRAAVQAGTHGLRLTNLEEMWRFSDAVAKSGIAPRGLQKPEQILVALQFGAELGLKPMQSLATVMVVNGRATLWGDGMLAVAQASGYLEDITEELSGDASKPESLVAICTVKRKGRPTAAKATFGYRDARQAGLLGKDTYKQYPGRMYKARARAWALRDAFPDVLCGILSTDEAEDFSEVVETQFIDGDQQAPSDLDQLMATDEGDVVNVDPQLFDDDPFAPSKEEMARDGLINP